MKSTLPELAVLGLTDGEIDQLREVTTGTPVVRGVRASDAALASSVARATVVAVREHPSHGSGNYYGPWIENYFRDLDASLGCVDVAVRANGTIALVVQDSHYKSIHIDLQTIIIETLAARGRTLRNRRDFTVSHSMARMNPAARRHLPARHNTESLLVFTTEPPSTEVDLHRRVAAL